jgi:hypothetical protein
MNLLMGEDYEESINITPLLANNTINLTSSLGSFIKWLSVRSKQ